MQKWRYRSNSTDSMSPRRYSMYSYRRRGFCTPIRLHGRAEDNGFLTANRPNTFPSHARFSPTSLDLNATWGVRARRDRKIFLCMLRVWVSVRVCGSVVAEEVDANVEFGGPYINQFHYHRDQGASEFPPRTTPRNGTRSGGRDGGKGSRADSFRTISISQFFVEKDKTYRRRIKSDNRSRNHLTVFAWRLLKRAR